MEYPVPEPNEPQTHPYQNFGGFLWFFLVSILLGYVLTIPVVITLFRAMDYYISSFAGVVTLVLLIIALVLDTTYIVQLLCCKSTFLTMFHVSAIWNCIHRPLQSLLLEVEPARIVTGFFSALFALVLYHLYFTRSVRVRTYMGTDAYITQCPFTRKVTPPTPAVPDQS